jgi:hypothetical protein
MYGDAENRVDLYYRRAQENLSSGSKNGQKMEDSLNPVSGSKERSRIVVISL